MALDSQVVTGRWLIAGAGLVLLLLVGLSAHRQGVFTPASHLYIVSPGAAGLSVGTPVRLRGFPIGEVDDLDLQNDLTVRVRLRVDSSRMALLSKDTTAKIARDTPVANKHIDLFPNPQEKTRLASEQTIRLESGQEIEDIIATVKGTLEQLNTTLGKVEPILNNVSVLTGQMADMAPQIRLSVAEAAANVKQTTANVKQTSGNVDLLVRDIAEQRTQMLGDVQGILGNAKQSSGLVNAMLLELNRELPPTLRAGRAAADDAAQMTDGLRSSWPFRSLLGPPPAPEPPQLDSFEATPP